MSKTNAATRLECDGWDYDVTIEPEQSHPRGHFGYDTEEENESAVQWVLSQLDAGNEYAWCDVQVTATESNPRPGFKARVGYDSLGACSYNDRADIMAMICREMKPEARSDAMNKRPELEPEAAHAAYAMLMSNRCADYGYDAATFRRISNQRSRARIAARLVTENGKHPERLNWHCAGDRLTFKRADNGQWTASYVVGQSQNEEITNLLRRLVNPEAKWQS